jgi:type VI secretion system secreted protein Hcp
VAAIDYFLKIDGIPGESVDAAHNGEIEPVSFSWGESAAAARTAGAGVGKVSLEQFHFTAKVTKASPLLLRACATGQHLKAAVLTARKEGGQGFEFLVVTLSDVVVSAYEIAGSVDADAPLDQVSLSFGRIEVEYRPQRPDGSPDAAVHVGWDARQAKAI